MNFDAILFDFDGVLVDSVDIKTRAFQDIFSNEHPDNISSIIELHLRFGGLDRIKKFKMIYDKILKRPIMDGVLSDLESRFRNITLESVKLAPEIPGATAALKSLYKKCALFVVSGVPETELVSIINSRKLGFYFSEIHGSPRSKETIINDLVIRREINPDKSVFIGDSLSDYNAAKLCGLKFIGVVPHDKPNLFEPGCITIEDLSNLDNVLNQI